MPCPDPTSGPAPIIEGYLAERDACRLGALDVDQLRELVELARFIRDAEYEQRVAVRRAARRPGRWW